MKKVFYQLGIFALSNFILYISGIALAIIACIVLWGNFTTEHYSEMEKLVYSPILLIPLGLGIHSIIYNAYNRVIFRDHQILITGQLGKDDGGFFTSIHQYKDTIDMRNIREVKLVVATVNSRKKVMRSHKGGLRPMRYFEFILADGTTKWMWITPFAKNQRKKMLAIINSKTGLNLSYDQLEEYQYFPRKKK